jgi:c-di-GMP-binding flagellar brake protein YcgR
MTNWLGRRKYPRYPIVLPVRHEILAPDRPVVGAGWTKDLSEGGACLELSDQFEKSTVLHLSLRTDVGRISLEATVAWTGQPADTGALLHGVTFHPPSTRDREALQNLLIRKRMLWRATVRVRVDLPLTCLAKGQSKSPFHGRTENVSRGGLYLRLPIRCATGTALEVVLRTPAGPISAEGTVVRVEPLDAQILGAPIGHGLQFTQISASAQMELSRVLADAP